MWQESNYYYLTVEILKIKTYSLDWVRDTSEEEWYDNCQTLLIKNIFALQNSIKHFTTHCYVNCSNLIRFIRSYSLRSVTL